MPRYCVLLFAPPHRSADCVRDVGRECGSFMPAQRHCVAVEPEVGINGDTQRFKSIRNDQVTAGDFNCRDVAVARSWCPVPKMTTSDLSALSCRPLCKNHSRTAEEQTARRSRAGVVSLMFIAMNSCVSSANWWYNITCDQS